MEQRVHNDILYRHCLRIVTIDNRSREAGGPPRAFCARTLPRPGVVSPQSECQRQVDVASEAPAAAPRWTQNTVRGRASREEIIVGVNSGRVLGGSAANRVCQPVKKPKLIKMAYFTGKCWAQSRLFRCSKKTEKDSFLQSAEKGKNAP